MYLDAKEKEQLSNREVSSKGKGLTSEDVATQLRHVRSQQYDVFLSYAEEDWEFAEEMRSRLVSQAKLRVFVPSNGKAREGEGLEMRNLHISRLYVNLKPGGFQTSEFPPPPRRPKNNNNNNKLPLGTTCHTMQYLRFHQLGHT